MQHSNHPSLGADLCPGLWRLLPLLALLAVPIQAATILCVLRDRDPVEPGLQMNDFDDPPYLERLRNLGHTLVLRGVNNADPASPDHAQTSDVTPGIDA